jgi:hypothetical protein
VDPAVAPAHPVLLTWEVTLGPAHTGDARLGSAFKVVAELSGLGRVGGEAVAFGMDPGKKGGAFTERRYRFGHTPCHVASSPPVLCQGFGDSLWSLKGWGAGCGFLHLPSAPLLGQLTLTHLAPNQPKDPQVGLG